MIVTKDKIGEISSTVIRFSILRYGCSLEIHRIGENLELVFKRWSAK